MNHLEMRKGDAAEQGEMQGLRKLVPSINQSHLHMLMILKLVSQTQTSLMSPRGIYPTAVSMWITNMHFKLNLSQKRLLDFPSQTYFFHGDHFIIEISNQYVVYLELTQCCRSIISQLKNNNFKN